MAEQQVVPMSQPATPEKNPDGTWSVRVQHADSGSVTFVHFGNVVFAEQLAAGYADFLNGVAKAEQRAEALVQRVKPAAEDAREEAAKLLADARDEAAKRVADAQALAGETKAKAEAALKQAQESARTLLDQAKAESGKAAEAARAKPETKPTATPKPAVEDE